MIMKPEPIFKAVEAVMGSQPESPIILLTPQGRIFNNKLARDMAALARLRERESKNNSSRQNWDNLWSL